MHPADLPAVLAGPDAGWWWSLLGVLVLVAVGLVMTALMQSSTAAIAVTMSAHYAGAVGFDQACALIIGQNVGTATSSALAAIGASTTAKQLAIAYVLFKLIAAVIALVLFPPVTPLLVRASSAIDGVTLLAGFHTAYNVVGVVVLLPLIDRFTRLVEHILPERGSPLFKARALFQCDRYGDARELILDAVQKYPEEVDILIACGDVMMTYPTSSMAIATVAYKRTTLERGIDIARLREIEGRLKRAQENLLQCKREDGVA
jgi:Na+/phosphate symporter